MKVGTRRAQNAAACRHAKTSALAGVAPAVKTLRRRITEEEGREHYA